MQTARLQHALYEIIVASETIRPQLKGSRPNKQSQIVQRRII